MRLEIVEGRENLLIYVREPVLCTRLNTPACCSMR